jgi:hypothetical protein
VRSRYSDSLRAERSGDQVSEGNEIFRTHPDGPWDPTHPPVEWVMVLFPGGKAAGTGR